MAKKSANYTAPLLYKSGLKIPVPDLLRLCGPFFTDILWAFEKFNCDPENLLDWQMMLGHFARDLKSRAPATGRSGTLRIYFFSGRRLRR
jgi:hypothetical protein